MPVVLELGYFSNYIIETAKTASGLYIASLQQRAEIFTGQPDIDVARAVRGYLVQQLTTDALNPIDGYLNIARDMLARKENLDINYRVKFIIAWRTALSQVFGGLDVFRPQLPEACVESFVAVGKKHKQGAENLSRGKFNLTDFLKTGTGFMTDIKGIPSYPNSGVTVDDMDYGGEKMRELSGQAPLSEADLRKLASLS